MLNPGLDFGASKKALISDECVFLRIGASFSFFPISLKTT